MLKGKVKFYNRAKEFGFITADDDQEYYFNGSSLLAPDEGDGVVFSVQDSAKGLMAKKVKVMGTPESLRAPVSRGFPWRSVIIGSVGVLLGVVLGLFVGRWF
jgi:cold shock protein